MHATWQRSMPNHDTSIVGSIIHIVTHTAYGRGEEEVGLNFAHKLDS